METNTISERGKAAACVPEDQRSLPQSARGHGSRWFSAAASLSLIAAVGSSAAAASTSSGSVEISVSVAAHYRVAFKTRAAGVRPDAQSGRLCLETNSHLPMTPVAIIWSRLDVGGVASAEPASGAATTILSCDLVGEHPKPDDLTSASRRAGDLLLIRPE